MTNALISTATVNEILGDPDLRIIDARTYVPGMGRNAVTEFAQSHLPSAIHYDLDSLSERDTPWPHMKPKSEKDLAWTFGHLGIAPNHDVVIYDTIPGLGAMRVWWYLKHLGHRNVAVMEGGWAKWVAEGRPVSDQPPTALPVDYPLPVRPGPDPFVAVDTVQRALDRGTAQVLDVRPANRFDGSVAEPRAGVRAGHMPGAFNLPWLGLFDADGTVKSKAGVLEALNSAGIDPWQPVITTCGSGVTAAAAAFVLTEVAGLRSVQVYDASWTEWGARDDLPLATGPGPAVGR